MVLLATGAASSAQNIPEFKAETKSALVWDESLPVSSTSSSVRDPLTGSEIHRLSYGRVEVSSRVGYEKMNPNSMGRLLIYSTTVANNSESDVSVHYGGASIDGEMALPLSIVPSGKKGGTHAAQQSWPVSKIRCFSSGFAPADAIFSSPTSGQRFTVRPNTSITVSFATKDPRDSARLCSVDGCHMTGSVRYYVTVNLTDYVFVWAGRSIVYCGH